MLFLGVGLVFATLSLTGAADVPSVALFMFLVPAVALSPPQQGANPPPRRPALRLLRVAQVTCLIVGFGLGAMQVLGSENHVVGRLVAWLFMVGIVLTAVFKATSWPAAPAAPQR